MTAEWFGPVRSVVGGGIGTILVVLMSMVLWPQLLKLGALHKEVPRSPLPLDADYEEEQGKVPP